MQKRTKILAGLGILALGGLLVTTQISGNTEDFQGRFSVQQNTTSKKINNSKNSKQKNTTTAIATVSGDKFVMPTSPRSQSIEDMLIEVPLLINEAENEYDTAANTADQINESMSTTINFLDQGNAQSALNELLSAESKLNTLKRQANSFNQKESRLKTYDDVLNQYIEEDWPNLIEVLEENLDQAQSDLQTATREAFSTKIQIQTLTAQSNDAYRAYGEAVLALTRAESHLEISLAEKRNFENGVEAIQEHHRNGNLSEYEQYSRIKDMIDLSIPILRTYHPNIKTSNQIRNNEETGRIVTETIPNKYSEMRGTTLPTLINQLTVNETIAQRQYEMKAAQLDLLIEEFEELEAEIERLTETLSANTEQGQNATHSMISQIQQAMIDGMNLSSQLAEYFRNNSNRDFESEINSHEEMIEAYRSLAEQLQAIE